MSDMKYVLFDNLQLLLETIHDIFNICRDKIEKLLFLRFF